MSVEFDVLHALRVKGLARPEVLSALSGVPEADLAAVCEPLVGAGQVLHRTGALEGYLLTPAGKAEAERLLAGDAETVAAKETLASFDETFLPVNSEFKQICHRWQVKPGEQPNDHTDASYDASVVADLERLHVDFVPVVDELGETLPRFSRYGGRLGAALERLKGGDNAAFARPMYDSYHDIWMELHNDVVLSLGRVRSAADEH